MTAVAVWDKYPTAQDLLDARVIRGWQPTPSNLQEGAKVLGYAACLVDD